MKTFLAATILSVLYYGAAFGGPPSGKKGGAKPSNHHSHHGSQFHKHGHHGVKIGGLSIGFNNYHHKHAKTFVGGWCYHGKVHSHWTYQCYWPKYKCSVYWCPSTCGYYYWSGTAGCYYPISYIATAAPTNVDYHGPIGSLPFGAPRLP